MPHNSLIHGGVGSGAWPNGYVLTQNDLQQIDQYLFQAANFDLGGTWAPSARVILGGQGLEVAGIFQADAAATFSAGLASNGASLFTANVTFSGVSIISLGGSTLFNVASTSSFTGPTNFLGGAIFGNAQTYSYLAGTTLSVAGIANFSGATTFAAATTFNALATCTAGLTVSGGQTNLNTTTNIGGFCNLSAAVVPLSGGHVRQRIVTTDPNAITIVGCTPGGGAVVFDLYRATGASLSADRTWTVTATNQGEGDMLVICMQQDLGTFTLHLVDDLTANIADMKNASGQINTLCLIFTGGAWKKAWSTKG